MHYCKCSYVFSNYKFETSDIKEEIQVPSEWNEDMGISKKRWKLFCLELSFIGWMLLSMLTFGILLLWVGPYMETAKAAFYEELKAKQQNNI